MTTEDSPTSLATAHQNWDERWKDAAVRAAWDEPEALVQALVPRMRHRGLDRVLDLLGLPDEKVKRWEGK